MFSEIKKKDFYGNVVTYLFHDDDEARSRWQTVAHHDIRRQEPQTKHLVEQVDGGKEETAQPGVAGAPWLGLWPQLEQTERNHQRREEHADPRAHHQRNLSKRIDQQVEVQHQPGRREEKQNRQGIWKISLCGRMIMWIWGIILFYKRSSWPLLTFLHQWNQPQECWGWRGWAEQ